MLDLTSLFAAFNGFGNDWSIGGIAVTVVIIAAIVGVVFIALRVFGVAIPMWAVHIFWICVVAFVAIVAIKFLVGL